MKKTLDLTGSTTIAFVFRVQQIQKYNFFRKKEDIDSDSLDLTIIIIMLMIAIDVLVSSYGFLEILNLCLEYNFCNEKC